MTDKLDYKTVIRVGMEQNILIIGIKIEDIDKLLNEQAGTESAGMKVRTRHLLNKVGDDEFIRYFRNSLSAENKQNPLNLKQLEKIEECNEVEHNIEDWIIKTSVRGKYALEYKPQGGNIDSAQIGLSPT